MLNVALTGSVGSGKSTVAACWADAGVPVVSADELAREAVLPGTPGLKKVREAFGESVLLSEGTLDRSGLRKIVFANEERRRTLEGILHPLIQGLRAQWVEEMRSAGATLVVSEIPLLFETGAQRDFDVTVLIDAPAELRSERLERDRGLSPREAREIMAAQMDSREKRAAADLVIENAGTLDELRAAAGEVLGGSRMPAALSARALP